MSGVVPPAIKINFFYTIRSHARQLNTFRKAVVLGSKSRDKQTRIKCAEYPGICPIEGKIKAKVERRIGFCRAEDCSSISATDFQAKIPKH